MAEEWDPNKDNLRVHAVYGMCLKDAKGFPFKHLGMLRPRLITDTVHNGLGLDTQFAGWGGGGRGGG